MSLIINSSRTAEFETLITAAHPGRLVPARPPPPPSPKRVTGRAPALASHIYFQLRRWQGQRIRR